ncbi:AzlC family ABC transporter permease [Oceanospirillum sp. HFRX-1_2]
MIPDTFSRFNRLNPLSPFSRFNRGALAMSPLTIAVLPWGVLVGSLAIDAGFTLWESQALSAILFAGAAQLVVIGMLSGGAGLLALLVTVFFITSRHLLYSVAMRSRISPLPLRWRLALGFLLTDELFAFCLSGQGSSDKGASAKRAYTKNSADKSSVAESAPEFDRWFALGAGLSFYLIWNLATLAGILLGNQFPQMSHWGLEFAVAATFIALVVPQITGWPVAISVLVALLLSVMLHLYVVPGALALAALGGMCAGYLADQIAESMSGEESLGESQRACSEASEEPTR